MDSQSCTKVLNSNCPQRQLSDSTILPFFVASATPLLLFPGIISQINYCIQILVSGSAFYVSPTSALMPLVFSNWLSCLFLKTLLTVTSSVMPFSIPYTSPFTEWGPPSSEILDSLHRLLLGASHSIVILCRYLWLYPLVTITYSSLSTQTLVECLIQSRCLINIWRMNVWPFCCGFLARILMYMARNWKPCSWSSTSWPREILVVPWEEVRKLSLPLPQDWLIVILLQRRGSLSVLGRPPRRPTQAIRNQWNSLVWKTNEDWCSGYRKIVADKPGATQRFHQFLRKLLSL